SPRLRSQEATEASLCRNNLFPNAVKKQSRCLSVLLQQGPHGGIRRVGPLLITCERGGRAIELLNPAFIDMMDVQPVDTETTALLNRSNIRRRSFSLPPHEHTADWYAAIANIVASQGVVAKASAESGRGASEESSGPGMWWPLNDDNCSDEIVYDQSASGGSQLIEMSMKTESGTITRCVKSMSLRLLVNRLASPEGNVDSDLLTDFLNSYRFFAHPIDVMRLLIVRYLNCFAPYSSTQHADDGDDDVPSEEESC
ncbi:hypothetical protein FBU59_005628, partial [Linderina macrospora]